MENFPEYHAGFMTNSLACWLGSVITAVDPTDTGPCWMCDDETNLLEVNFEAWLCSEVCANEAWEGFRRANYDCDRADFEAHPERWQFEDGGIRYVHEDVDFDL